MATLHVRNVPDDLYELLREAAEREGRSIGAEALKLIEYALSDRRRRRDELLPIRHRHSPFLRRFAESGREIVLRAQAHARELGSGVVTPAHVLLAMLDDDVLRASLEAAGITEEAVRARLPRGTASGSNVPFSAETKTLLEAALRKALAAKRDEMAPEDLLFALGRTKSLAPFDLPRALSAAPAQPEEEYRAIVLQGGDDAWTAQLNELAAEGWELFSVTTVGGEVRAILRRG